MTFENGLTISCQMGSDNYCSNRDSSMTENQRTTECNNCEVAIRDKDNRWITGEIFAEMGMDSTEDAVAGWVDTMTVAKVIAYVSSKMTNVRRS